MSITKPEDLLFVEGANVDSEHPLGDLNRIDWSLPIMPLRTGNTSVKDKDGEYVPKKRILAGVDKAFAMEALDERRLAIEPNRVMPKKVFSREICSDWFDAIELGFLHRNNSWAKTIDFSNVDLSESDSVFNNHFYVIGDMELPIIPFPTDGGLSLANMEAMFRDIDKLKYYRLTFPSDPYTTTKTIYHDYPRITSHYNFSPTPNRYVYEYHMTTWNYAGGLPIDIPNGSGANVLTSFDGVLDTGAYAKNVLFYIFKLDFLEEYIAPNESDSVTKTFAIYVKVNADASNNKKPSVSDFNAAIDRCLQHKGITRVEPRPIIEEDWMEFQDIYVNIVSACAICELRDRTRWTLSE